MAGELQAMYLTAQNVYVIGTSTVGTVIKTSDGSLVAYATANLSQYTITLTEQGTASGRYVGTMPAGVAAGVYGFVAYARAGGSPAEGDSPIATGSIEWDGSAVVPLYSRLAPTVASRTLDVTATGAAGIDWGNVENLTTTNALTGTTIAVTQKVDIETIKTRAVTCAAAVTVGAYVGNATAPILVSATGQVYPATLDAGFLSAILTGATASTVVTSDNGTPDNFYRGDLLWVTAGTGINQVRSIVSSVTSGGSTTYTVDSPFITTPVSGDFISVIGARLAKLDTSLRVTADVETINGSTTIDGYTPEEIVELAGAVLLGKASGGPGSSVFRSMDDSADRVASTADSDGNRTAVTLTT